MSAYPVTLDGAHIRALIVGAGPVAARKASALLDAGATVRIVAPQVCAELRAQAGRQRLTLIEREYHQADVGDATLVVAATNVRAVNERVAADARACARLVNVADAPDESDWITVAQHRAGPLAIGVSTGGVPAAAARIRDALAGRFDDRYASTLSALAQIRRGMINGDRRSEWREAQRALVDARFCDAVESGEMEARLATWR